MRYCENLLRIASSCLPCLGGFSAIECLYSKAFQVDRHDGSGCFGTKRSQVRILSARLCKALFLSSLRHTRLHQTAGRALDLGTKPAENHLPISAHNAPSTCPQLHHSNCSGHPSGGCVCLGKFFISMTFLRIAGRPAEVTCRRNGPGVEPETAWLADNRSRTYRRRPVKWFVTESCGVLSGFGCKKMDVLPELRRVSGPARTSTRRQK